MPSPFGTFPLSITGPIIPGAVLRVVSSHGVVRCDPSVASMAYTHQQATPAATWVCNHAMGKSPNVRAYSVGGREMLGEIVHTSLSQTVIYFDGPVAGYAVCA